MPTPTRAVVQLPTRTFYALRHRAKVNRGVHDTPLTQFVIETFRERLDTQRAAPQVAVR